MDPNAAKMVENGQKLSKIPKDLKLARMSQKELKLFGLFGTLSQ